MAEPLPSRPARGFPLAPMSAGIYWLTALLLLLPALLLVLGFRAGHPLAFVPALIVAGLYLYVWLWLRPTRFELTERSLDIVWPLRRHAFLYPQLAGAEPLVQGEFRQRFGWVVRVGAGGLWGGFGLLVGRRGKLRFYISRLDGMVLVTQRSGLPLLVTPTDPELFVQALSNRLERG